MSGDRRASFFRKPWVRIRNTESEEIPPYACCRITGATMHRGEIVYTVGKPNATAQDWYLVNGPAAIPATGTLTRPEGLGTFLTDGGFVMYDDSDTPTLGEAWGPEDGEWHIKKGGRGFEAIGGEATVAGNPVLVAVQGAAPAIVRYSASAGSISISSGTDTQITLASESDLTSDGGLSLASGIVTVETGGRNYWMGISATVTVPFQRNDYCDVSIHVQSRVDSGSAWTAAGLGLRERTYHPDVAIGAGGAVSHIWRMGNLHIRSPFNEGNQFRVVYDASVNSSVPAGAQIDAVRLMFFTG